MNGRHHFSPWHLKAQALTYPTINLIQLSSMKFLSCTATILPLFFAASLFIQLLVVLPLHLGNASEVDPRSESLEGQAHIMNMNKVEAIKLELMPF